MCDDQCNYFLAQADRSSFTLNIFFFLFLSLNFFFFSSQTLNFYSSYAVGYFRHSLIRFYHRDRRGFIGDKQRKKNDVEKGKKITVQKRWLIQVYLEFYHCVVDVDLYNVITTSLLHSLLRSSHIYVCICINSCVFT